MLIQIIAIALIAITPILCDEACQSFAGGNIYPHGTLNGETHVVHESKVQSKNTHYRPVRAGHPSELSLCRLSSTVVHYRRLRINT